MSKIYITEYSSPVGVLLVGSLDDKLCMCDWRERKGRTTIDNRLQGKLGSNFKVQDTEFNKRVIAQLEGYFSKQLRHFDLPLQLVGTEFQKKVWHALMETEYGTTLSYGELATKLGSKSAVRAVANANGANALSIIVPCHRIIGSNGKLTGYAGGLDAKKALLALEHSNA